MTTLTGCGNTGWTICPSQRHTDSSFPFTNSPYNGLHKVPESSPEALLSIKLDFSQSPVRRVADSDMTENTRNRCQAEVSDKSTFL